MPPKASNQKRKRGQPPGASKVDQVAYNSEAPETNDDPDVEEQSRPRKRGRKPNAEKVEAAANSAAQDSSVQPARRGRPPKTGQQDAATHAEALPEQLGKATGKNPKGVVKNSIATSKGKRILRESNELRAEDEPSGSAPRPSARERRAPEPATASIGGQQSDEHEDQPTSLAGKAKHKKRAHNSSESAASKSHQQGRRSATEKTGSKGGRPISGNEDSRDGRVLQPQQGNRTKAPGRASKQVGQSVAAGPEGEASQPKRRGRPKASDGSSQASKKDQPSEARPHVRGRPPKPGEDQHEAPPKPNPKAARPRRQEPAPEQPVSSEPEEEDDEEEESELPFRYVREVTKNIPRNTISEKWRPLDGPSITAVGAFMADAQRPVLLRLQDTHRRREHASSALSVISRRLRSKLVKGFPFPAPTAGVSTRAGSGSYEDEFNFERTVDATQALDNMLNPLQHSVALLEREIKREEDALAKDYDSLHRLEANARSEAKKWREQAKREHALAPGIKRTGEGGGDADFKDSLELVPRSEEESSGGPFEGLQDEELVTISKQIGSHMESMKGNLQQIGGVVPAIVKSKAVLQQVLLKHLDDEQYERVSVG